VHDGEVEADLDGRKVGRLRTVQRQLQVGVQVFLKLKTKMSEMKFEKKINI
jgi:hypothetical protein